MDAGDNADYARHTHQQKDSAYKIALRNGVAMRLLSRKRDHRMSVKKNCATGAVKMHAVGGLTLISKDFEFGFDKKPCQITLTLKTWEHFNPFTNDDESRLTLETELHG